MNIREFKWSSVELSKIKPLSQVDYIVIHHTDSADVPVEEINRWHKENGWVGVGYHYIIRTDGAVEKGRPDNKQGAHVKNYNHCSLGIVLTGKLSEKPPTTEQMDSLERLLSVLLPRYPDVNVLAHFRLAPTDCPGNKFPWDDFWRRLERARKNVLQGVPGWAAEPIRWALDNKIINTPQGSDDFYRLITALFNYDKQRG